MFAIGNDEINDLPHYAVDLADKNGEFEIVHTNEDGSEEICKVKSGKNVDDGSEIWTIGGYTTKEGKTYLAVVAGKVLSNIKLNKT